MALGDERMLSAEYIVLACYPLKGDNYLQEELCYVKRHDFIFSNKTTYRVSRHLVFWLVYLSHVFLFRYYLYDLKYLGYASTYLIRLQNLALFLPVTFFYAYFSLYFLLPRFIMKGRYAGLLLCVVLLSVLLMLVSYFISTSFNIRLAWDIPLTRASIVRQMDFTVSNGLVYPLTVSTFAIGIKMTKNWYLKQKENERLANLKIKNEVQLFKTQIHPRFLFNTLNGIHTHTLTESAKSPWMLLKLSDLLSYILYENEAELVPLEKELAMVQDYIALEKASHNSELNISFQNTLNASDKLITPLLLLHLVECVFEQNNKKNHELSISVKTQMKENLFYFSIILLQNSRQFSQAFYDNSRFQQVEKRLQAQYYNTHDLNIITENNTLNIYLTISLGDDTLTLASNSKKSLAI